MSKSWNLAFLMKIFDQKWILCSVFLYFQTLKKCIFGLIRPVKLLQTNFYKWKDHYLSISARFKKIHWYTLWFEVVSDPAQMPFHYTVSCQIVVIPGSCQASLLRCPCVQYWATELLAYCISKLRQTLTLTHNGQ